jgi:maltose-binding protein MalE
VFHRYLEEKIMARKSMVCLLIITLLSLSMTVAVQAQDEPDLLIWADGTRAPVLTELAAQFSEEFGLNVSVQEIALGNIRSDIGVAGPAGEGPDIIVAVHDWIGELVLNGSVVPINLGDKAAEFTEASLKLFTYNDELYGMPYAVENVAFFRNPDLVPDAPATSTRLPPGMMWQLSVNNSSLTAHPNTAMSSRPTTPITSNR